MHPKTQKRHLKLPDEKLNLELVRNTCPQQLSILEMIKYLQLSMTVLLNKKPFLIQAIPTTKLV
jgi:hypothetical protein